MNINTKSIVFDTDSYKVSMAKQYPPNTEYVYSYISSRGGKPESLYFGLQAFLRDVLSLKVTKEEVEAANIFWTAHGEPFPYEEWMYIATELGGVLPLEVYGLDEGTMVPANVPMVSICNTDPKCFWLTTWVETAMLRAVWYGTTVATKSFSIRKIIKSYLEKSGDVSGLNFKLHDFGSRGASSNETAALGGMAHLATGSMGTDTAISIIAANQFYDAPIATTAFSIPASEHSTITSWGRDKESLAYENMIKQFSRPGSIYAVVSDSYNIYNAVENMWGKELRDQVISSGGTLVIRPDSDDPVVVLPRLFESIANSFGYTVNDKGYKVLNNVRFIWGDGINELSIISILRMLVDNLGYSADNIAFGMGGALLQIVNRDDLKFAMKCSAVGIREETGLRQDGILGKLEWRDVFKDPITDPGKKSLAGRVTATKVDGKLQVGLVRKSIDEMKCRFINGSLLNQTTFEEIRALVNQ